MRQIKIKYASAAADTGPRYGIRPTSTAGPSTDATTSTTGINAKRPMGNMPVAYYRGGNQIGRRHGVQPSGDGAGGDCRQYQARPADTLRHSGVGAGESILGTGIPKGTS